MAAADPLSFDENGDVSQVFLSQDAAMRALDPGTIVRADAGELPAVTAVEG